jgi:hypothetical protein
MRFGLIDFLYAIACLAIGLGSGVLLAPEISIWLSLLAGVPIGLGVYLVLLYPFYRGMKLMPIVLPRCPCCESIQWTHQILGGPWPRLRFRCTSCNDLFVVWFNGKPGKTETWEAPVLLLKWPYAFGRYRLTRQPKKKLILTKSALQKKQASPAPQTK